MSGTSLPIGLEGVDFTSAVPAVSAATPEYPGMPFQPGTRVSGTNGSVWIFVVAGSGITVGDVCIVSALPAFTALGISNVGAKDRLGRLVGVAGATAASGQGFWLQVAGYNASVNAATSSAAWTVLSSTSTTGRIGGASATNSAKVNGITLLATAASNTAAAILNFPAIGTND
jgi:hypothetical protein